MALTVKQYTRAIWKAQRSVAQTAAGIDLRTVSVELRLVLLLADLAVGIVIQALVTAGIVTDAAVQQRLDAVASAAYPALPTQVRAADPDQGYDPPDPDLGA